MLKNWLRISVWAGSLVLLALLLPDASRAGAIEGRVSFLGGHPARSGSQRIDPYSGHLGSMISTGPNHESAETGLGEIVVYLPDADGPNPASRGKPNPQLEQIDQSFRPRVLGVPVGSVVDFPNLDPVYHNVFSYSKAKRFDLGRYGKGKSKSIRFDKPGLIKVFCDIHSNMSAFIFVAETPWVTQPDPSGNFSFADVPPGTHILKLWHPDRGMQTIEVEVGAGTTRVDLKF